MTAAPLVFTLARRAPRLDSWLAAAHPDLSRSRWKQLIATGHVLLNGAPALKPNTALAPGDTLVCTLPPPEPVGLAAADIPLDIIHEDADLIVLNKPAGLVVHPAPGHATDTLVNALLHHCADLPGIGGERRPGIVHRLDKDTSGVLVVAKTEQAMAHLVAQFSAHTVAKEYLALVWGTPRPAAGRIELPIGRHPVNRKKMAVTPRGRHAVTRYETLATGAQTALVRVCIETGRTHQIRVHLARLGHPVAGDTTYGRARHGLPADWKIPRQLLHAHVLEIIHPRTGRPRVFTAPPPPDFRAARDILVGAVCS